MRVLIFLSALLIAFSATAQDTTTKNLAIIKDGVVVNIIAINKDWTETEWAPFVPAGTIAIPSETAHITDRYIDGKIMRQFVMPREDGWMQLILGDVDNPPEPVRKLILKPWTLSPTYEPPAKEQVRDLKARIEELESKIK
jgi:hypothetical protein